MVIDILPPSLILAKQQMNQIGVDQDLLKILIITLVFGASQRVVELFLKIEMKMLIMK